MYRVGLSTSGKGLGEDLFASYQENGISAMELSIDMQDYPNLDYQRLSKLSKKYDINLWSFHLPFYLQEELDISSLNKERRDNSLIYLSEIIKKATDIGFDKFVIHPNVGEPIEDTERPDRISYSKESLVKLSDAAVSGGGVIAIENLPRTNLGNTTDEMLDLVSADERLRICMDVNHCMEEDTAEMIRKLGNKIITTHISDFDFVNERHWLPGEGKNDWNAILDAFKAIGYQGVWMYEVRFVCPGNIIRDRDLTCADFAQNARELFARKKPTVISRPKENIEFWDIR